MTYTPLVDGDAATPAKLNAIFTELDNSIGSGGSGSGSMFINVLDTAYGATGDGTTDDTAAVTAAIAACDDTLGGTILFPGGKNYLIDQVTLNKPNITILAYGATFTKATTTVGHMFQDLAGAADGFKIYGATIDLKRASFSNGNTVSAFHFVRTQKISFHDLYIKDGIEEGLKLYRTKYTKVHNCTFDNIRNNGVQANATDSDGYTGAGRSTQSTEWLWVHGCHFKDIDDALDGALDGQAVSFGSTSATLRAKHIYITNNSIENCIRGIWSENNTSGSPGFNYVIEGNTIYGNDHHGIGVFGCVGGSIANNSILDTGQIIVGGGSSENFGIKLGASTATTRDVVVQGNAIVDSRASVFMEYGIWATGGENVTIRDNRISGVAVSDISVVWSTMTKSNAIANVTPRSKTSAVNAFNLANAAWTNIWWDGVKYDTESMASMHTTTSDLSHALTTHTPGYWDFRANVTYPEDSTGLRGARLALGSAGTVIAEEIRSATSGDDTSFSVSGKAKMNAGDFVRLLLYQSSGDTLSVAVNSSKFYLSATYEDGE